MSNVLEDGKSSRGGREVDMRLPHGSLLCTINEPGYGGFSAGQ